MKSSGNNFPFSAKPSEVELIGKSAENWSAWWDEQLKLKRTGMGAGKGKWEFLKRAGGFNMFKNVLRKEIGGGKNLRILEAGSGSGEMARVLAKEGHCVIALDVSMQALKLTAESSRDDVRKPILVQGSIFALPFKAGMFDFVFNAGVIDHFGEEGKVSAVEEMLRTAGKQSKIVVAVNDAKSIIHPPAIKYAVKKGIWRYGYKDEVRSLRPVIEQVDSNLKVTEYSRGFVSQFEFVRYFLPQKDSIIRLFFKVFHIVTFPFAFLNRFPGHLLIVSIIHPSPLISKGGDKQ